MYQIPDLSVWQGRTDEIDGLEGLRWHQRISPLDLSQTALPFFADFSKKIAFLGFACEEGVKRNKGRLGAGSAPPLLKKALSNLPFPFENLQLFDAGTVICEGEELEKAQAMLAHKVEKLIKNDFFPVVLGGGHETAFGHFCGLADSYSSTEKIGIVNFDAHFDLRLYAEKGNSGTPFLQIAKRCEAENRNFAYQVLGILESGNTKALFETAKRLKVQYLLAEQINEWDKTALEKEMLDFADKQDRIYISIDLDVFSAAFAPAVSAVNGAGLSPERVFPLLRLLLRSGKVCSLDIVEYCPPYEIDQHTARLVANLAYEVVKSLSKTNISR